MKTWFTVVLTVAMMMGVVCLAEDNASEDVYGTWTGTLDSMFNDDGSIKEYSEAIPYDEDGTLRLNEGAYRVEEGGSLAPGFYTVASEGFGGDVYLPDGALILIKGFAMLSPSTGELPTAGSEETAGSLDGEDVPEWVDKYVIDKDGQIVYDENGLHIVFYGFIENSTSFEHGIPDLLIINETGQDIIFYSDEQFINSIEASNWNGDVDLANDEYLYLKNEYNCMFDLEDLTSNKLKSITDYEMRFTVKTAAEDREDRKDLFSGTIHINGDYSIFDIWPEIAYLAE